MKNQRKIDIEKLIDITIEFLSTEGLIPFDLNSTARGADNVIGKLCTKFFGHYCLRDSVYISTIWKRNNFNFRSRVNNVFSSQKSLSEKLEICLSESENKFIQSLIVCFGDGRKRFSAEFTEFISTKIQEKGFKCWLKANYNWFRKENSRKNGDYWAGKYECILGPNIFKMHIAEWPFNKIIIELEAKVCCHEEFIPAPKNRIRGEKRKLLAHEIVSKGVGNFRAENYLKNSGKNFKFNYNYSYFKIFSKFFRYVHRL